MDRKALGLPERRPRQPRDQRFHASASLGFTDTSAQDDFLTGSAIEKPSNQLALFASAIHADDVVAALTSSDAAESFRITRSKRQ